MSCVCEDKLAMEIQCDLEDIQYDLDELHPEISDIVEHLEDAEDVSLFSMENDIVDLAKKLESHVQKLVEWATYLAQIRGTSTQHREHLKQYIYNT